MTPNARTSSPKTRIATPLRALPLGLVLSLGSACAGTSGTMNTDMDTRTFAQQVTAGGALYGEHCAECHGDSGQGTDMAPRVVGDGALPRNPPDGATARTTQFRTALDVFAFASEAMPGDAPGSLPDGEMVDILAFALSANGVTLEEPLSGATAESVVINP